SGAPPPQRPAWSSAYLTREAGCRLFLVEPELPSDAVLDQAVELGRDLRHPVLDLGSERRRIADGVRGHALQQVPGFLDLFLQFAVVGDVAEVESVQEVAEL